MFKKPFSFNGRIRRLEYGLSYLLYMLVFYGSTIIINPTGGFSLSMLIIFIICIWFLLAQGTKRCHDRGASGWWLLIPFYNLILLFADGNVGNNEYGPNPKGIGNYDEIDEIGDYLENKK